MKKLYFALFILLYIPNYSFGQVDKITEFTQDDVDFINNLPSTELENFVLENK